jgi:hypothetical protein
MDGFKKPVEPVEPKKRAPKKPKEDKPIALEIVCDMNKKEQAAEIAFSENMEANGVLILRNPICGGSMEIPDFQFFPMVNRKCTCGQRGHFMVKYTAK